jgi:hypothetical protein
MECSAAPADAVSEPPSHASDAANGHDVRPEPKPPSMECSADAASDVSASDAASDVSASDAAYQMSQQMQSQMSRQMQPQMSQQMQSQQMPLPGFPNGHVQQNTASRSSAGAPAGLEAEFGLNMKKDEEKVVESPSNDTHPKESDFNKETHGIPIIKSLIKEQRMVAKWNTTGFGNQANQGKCTINLIGCLESGYKFLIDQFEKEKMQQKGKTAKTVPPYFIIPYFQSIFTSSLLSSSLITLTRRRNQQRKMQR